MERSLVKPFAAAPVIGGVERSGIVVEVSDPSDHRRIIGSVIEATMDDADEAIGRALRAQPGWDALGGPARAVLLERVADLLEAELPGLLARLIREGGRTLPDALDEVREAVDFCRYYAAQARLQFGPPEPLPGPTGERNSYALHGRGVFVCISPWNFPLAIFLGQIAAALAAGNAVVAKPAEQTPLVAAEAIRLLLRAGIPDDVVHLLPGDGRIGAALVADPRIAGVAFTGSTETAQRINRSLAGRDGPIVPLIAETGGLNALIADSSALPEQLVADVFARPSIGRPALLGAARAVRPGGHRRPGPPHAGRCGRRVAVGDPGKLSTDIGPVIDSAARAALDDHLARMPRPGCAWSSCRCRTGPNSATSLHRRSSSWTRSTGSTARCSARSSMCSAGPATSWTR